MKSIMVTGGCGFVGGNMDLGWTREASFETGIRKTQSWYLDHQSWADRVRSGAYQDWIREHYGK